MNTKQTDYTGKNLFGNPCPKGSLADTDSGKAPSVTKPLTSREHSHEVTALAQAINESASNKAQHSPLPCPRCGLTGIKPDRMAHHLTWCTDAEDELLEAMSTLPSKHTATVRQLYRERDQAKSHADKLAGLLRRVVKICGTEVLTDVLWIDIKSEIADYDDRSAQ